MIGIILYCILVVGIAGMLVWWANGLPNDYGLGDKK